MAVDVVVLMIRPDQCKPQMAPPILVAAVVELGINRTIILAVVVVQES